MSDECDVRAGFPVEPKPVARPTKISITLALFRMGKTTSPCNLLDLQRQPPLRALRGWTSLHYAANRGHNNVVQRLLAAGAAVEAANNKGRGLGREIFWGGSCEWRGWEGEMRMGRKWMQWKMMATGRGFSREVWRWLPDHANNVNNVNRTCLLKVGDRLNEFLLVEKTQKETWRNHKVSKKSGRKHILTDMESSFESAAQSQHTQKNGQVFSMKFIDLFCASSSEKVDRICENLV